MLIQILLICVSNFCKVDIQLNGCFQPIARKKNYNILNIFKILLLLLPPYIYMYKFLSRLIDLIGSALHIIT